LARRLCDQPVTSKAGLIAATGLGQQQEPARSAEAGIDYHLVKPVDLAALRGILQRMPSGQKG
jgi:CheY-like chemotaxis protein